MSNTVLPQRLQGTVCVVTGAARGIGYAIAERFLAEGGRVACLDASQLRTAPAVEALAKAGEARGYTVDVSARAAVAEVAAKIERDFGAPTGVLVNNAVWARFQPLAEIDDETLDRTLAVGLKASIWMMQAFVPQMQRRGSGSIINVSSTSASRALTGSMAYAAMKASVLGLTRAAAVELSAHKIRVNTIVPGMIGTPAATTQYDDATLAARLSTMPLARFGEPAEIAAIAAFLASADSGYIQGAEIVADGGWTIAAT